MAKKKRSIDEKLRNNRIKQEFVGITIVGLAVFVLLSLLSYSHLDPSFRHYVAQAEVINNIFGTVGSHSADALFFIFGFTSYLIPLILLFWASKQLLQVQDYNGAVFFFGVGGLLFSLQVLLALSIPQSNIYGTSFSSGGVVGDFAVSIFISYLNVAGTAVVAIIMLLLSLVVLVNFSLVITSKASFRFALHSLYFLQRKILLLWRTIKNRFIPIQRNVPKIGHPSAEQQKNAQAKPKISQEQFDFCRTDGSYIFPEINLLDNVEKKDENIKKEYLIANSQILERKLADFGVETKVTEVRPGPVVTTYELEPAAGVKINKITTLADDLSLALRAKSIRIIAPLPERGTIGIEIPNQHRESVYFKSMLESEAFQNSKSKISIALGADIVGMPVIVALEKMPHLLIAGTTGSGKSVALNAMICSILFKASPDEVKFLMIDPKRLELSSYEGIPHLLYPVVTDAKEASIILRWAVAEMERRYRVISETSVRNITDYNRLIDKTVASSPKGAVSIQKDTELANGVSSSLSKEDKLPYIVLVIDELADLMMVAQKDVETSLTRLAQMARAAGIHIILATQRPSVDVITGLIKANFPTRISFHVSSRIDSRTILDQLGAESLLGAGDMLFMPSGSSELTRIHGAFVSDQDISKIVEHIKKQRPPVYDTSILEGGADEIEESPETKVDERYQEAVELTYRKGEVSISLVQRYLKVGYNRAARIVEQMEMEGIIGPADGSKLRKVITRR